MRKIREITILDIPIHPISMKEAVSYLSQQVETQKTTFVVTANAEIVMMGNKDADYKRIIQTADLVLPDGAGTVWAGRTLGYKVPERVAGFDLFLNLLKEASTKGYKIFFFGSAPGIAEKAKAKCLQEYPSLQIVGCRNGYFSPEDDLAIVQEINNSGAQILFTALGAPKQEFWLSKYAQLLTPFLLMGIGGSFDVLAGKMERAPKWMQDASMEWLFRLYKQPKRFFRMLALPHFVLKVWREKYL